MTKTPRDKISLGSLDHIGQLPITMDPIESRSGEPLALRMYIDAARITSQLLLGSRGHLAHGLKLWADNQPLTTQVIEDRVNKTLLVDAQVPPTIKTVTLRLYNEPIVTLSHEAGDLKLEQSRLHERICSSDLRILGTSEVQPPSVPTQRTFFAGFDAEKHAPITDLHTHSSAQISNEQLMKMALRNNIAYPVELLSRLREPILLSDDEQEAVLEKGGKGNRFSPLEEEGLACEKHGTLCDVIPLAVLTAENRAKLTRQLTIPQDTTMCFSEFDKQYYRFVNPIVKNPKMAYDLIRAIGHQYKKNGVKYAELSTASMLNIDVERDDDGNILSKDAAWFREMVRATRDVENEDGVQLRYLIGIPRTYSPQQVMTELQKVKYAARHPLIAGVDLLGYESNKVGHFKWPLESIARWAKEIQDAELKPQEGWDFKRDFTIRVHAGETNKNYGNVNAAVDIAEKHGVTVRIAHALNELPDEKMNAKIQRLSSRMPPLVSMEFCPDSNIAYNNVRRLSEVPFKRWLKVCKSWFLGSDGAGAIQTDPVQMALSALGAGVAIKQLEQMRVHEQAFIECKQEAFAAKSQAFHAHYQSRNSQQDTEEQFLDGLAAHTLDVMRVERHLHRNPDLPDEFKNKIPILIAGAADDSMGALDTLTRREIERSMRMLVATVDPKKAFFVLGRTKAEGVLKALDRAILEYNQEHAANQFSVLGLTTKENRENALSVAWPLELPGDKDSVAEKTIELMRHHPIPGLALFFGGKTYTGDMIKNCLDSCNSVLPEGQHEVNYLVMETASGATKNWAADLRAERKFSDSLTMIPRIAATMSDAMGDRQIFRDDVRPFDQPSLQALQEEFGAGFSEQISRKHERTVRLHKE